MRGRPKIPFNLAAFCAVLLIAVVNVIDLDLYMPGVYIYAHARCTWHCVVHVYVRVLKLDYYFAIDVALSEWLNKISTQPALTILHDTE